MHPRACLSLFLLLLSSVVQGEPIECAADGTCATQPPPPPRPDGPPPAECMAYIMHDRNAVYDAYADAVKRQEHAEAEAERVRLAQAAVAECVRVQFERHVKITDYVLNIIRSGIMDLENKNGAPLQLLDRLFVILVVIALAVEHTFRRRVVETILGMAIGVMLVSVWFIVMGP